MCIRECVNIFMAFVICCQITLQNLWSFYILNILLQEKNEEKEKSIGLLESETEQELAIR